MQATSRTPACMATTVFDFVRINVEAETRIMSFLRSTSLKKTIRVTMAMSPVASQPSPFNTLAICPDAASSPSSLAGRVPTFARLTHRNFVAGFVTHRAFGGRHGRLIAPLYSFRVQRADTRSWRGLGQTVGFDQRNAGNLFPFFATAR